MEIERFIPDSTSLNRHYKSFLLENDKELPCDESDYLEIIQRYEKEYELYLIKVLQHVGIQATTKTNRYSLPYKHEIIEIQQGENTLCKIFDFKELVRKILLELLSKNVRKIRFYLISDLEINKDEESIRPKKVITMKFRYTIHNNF